MAHYQKTCGYVVDAYCHLLLGRSDDQLYDMEFSKSDIIKAKIFRDRFQERDVFRNIIAKEMGVSVGLVGKLQKIYMEHQAREQLRCTGL